MNAPAAEDGGDGQGAWVLLVGDEATSLAPRLALSGYRPIGGDAKTDAASAVTPSEEGSTGPAAVVLASDRAANLVDLRERWGGVPILLGLRADSIEEIGRAHV